jgi:hypothetical protein
MYSILEMDELAKKLESKYRDLAAQDHVSHSFLYFDCFISLS